MDALSEEFTVVAWDAPGCGQSSDPPEGFSLGDYADCLADFLQIVGVDRPHVLGLSFGGGLAIQFYGRHPAVPKSLILASAYAGWAGSLPPEEVERRKQKAIRDTKLQPKEVVDSWTPSLFSDSVSDEVIRETEEILSDFHPEGAMTMLFAFADADLRDVLPTIDVPTLLLYGSEDVRSPVVEVAQEMHASIATSELVVMPGVGHVSNLEAPGAFNAEVLNFLREQES